MWIVQQLITKIHKLPAWYGLSLVPGSACTGEYVELEFWLSPVIFPRRSEMSSPHAILEAWLSFCGRGVLLDVTHFDNGGEERG